MAAGSVRGAAAASLQSPTPPAPGTPVFDECPNNDDERERRQRRRSRAVESSLQGLGSPSLRPEGWQPQLPRWSNEQISEHYSTCIKLSTENKITTKNAFGLHLIDYMADILKQNSELINFQVAAGTLDASAKIYAARVDSVHADTFRVLDHLGKEPAPARDPDSSEEGAGSSPVPEAARKAAPRKKQSFQAIEHNLSNINAPEAGGRRQVDPMFQRALASFDEGSTAGVFLRQLRTQGFQSRLLFPSEMIPLPSSESRALPSSESVSVPGLKALLAACAEKRPICSSLAGFKFTKGDEESHEESVSALLEKFGKSEHVFDPDLDPDGDDWAPSQPEFLPDSPDGDESREFRESGDGLGTPGQSQRSAGAAFGEGDIGTLSRHLSLNPGEYSYFSPRTLSMWAGPEHWRFRPRHLPAPAPPKDSRRRIPREAFEFDFQEKIDFDASFRKTKASTTLAKSTLESRTKRSTTLPADFNYDPQNLEQLFLKLLVKISESRDPVEILDNEAGIEDYDYNNPNDSINFCPALQVSDSDSDSDLDPDPVEFPGPLPAQAEAPEPCGELELIAEPQKIHKIPIQYARTAKRIDMGLLKRSMWELLTEQETGTEGEESGERPEPEVAGEKRLSDLYCELKHRLPPAMASNLSGPMAFLGLLHVASEKNLELEGTEDLSDVVVKQGH